MTQFEAQLNQARRRHRRAIGAALGAVLAILVGIAAWLVVTNGTPVKVLPDEAAPLAEIQIVEGWGLVVDDVVYTLGVEPRLRVEAEGYEAAERRLAGDRKGRLLTIELTPLPSHLIAVAEPEHERLRWLIDGALAGLGGKLDKDITPGSYELAADHPHFQIVRETIAIGPGEQVSVVMRPLPVAGKLVIQTEPAGAMVSVNGQALGPSPAAIDLPGGFAQVEVSQDGFAALADEVEVTRAQPVVSRNYRLISDHPPPLARPRPVAIEAPKAQPKPPEPPKAAPAANPARYKNAAGIELKLFRPGSFVMGAPRGEKGARANEFLREVRLTRPFYAGLHEVTRGQFAAFDRSFAPGIANQPATNIAWETAAAFCNWLSEQEGLGPFYGITQGRVDTLNADADGYRLLTEAEWEWLARRAGKPRQTVFVWGDEAVLPVGAGNIADESARGSVASYVPAYNDAYAGLAPVGSFPAEPSGLFDQAGNVTEWVHDHYSLVPPMPGSVATDPLGPGYGEGHVVKGANWRSGGRTELRPAYREGLMNRRDDVGFRIGRYAQQRGVE